LEKKTNIYKKAIAELKEQLKTETDLEKRLDLLLKLVDKLSLNSPGETIDYAEETWELAEQQERSLDIGHLRNYLAYANCTLCNFEEARDFISENIDEFELSHPYSVVLYQAYYNLARIWEQQGEFNKGRPYYLHCLVIAEELKDVDLYLKACTQVSKSYFKLGSFSDATRYVEMGMQMDNGIPSNGLAFLYNMVGILHTNQEAHDKAVIYYEKALKIWEDLGYYFFSSFVHNNIGCVYTRLNRFPEALENFHKALDLYKEMGSIVNTALAYHNIGDVYLTEGNYEECLKYQGKALEIVLQTNDKFGIIQASISLVQARVKLAKDVPDSLTILARAQSLAEEIDAKVLMLEVYSTYTEIYELEEKYELAFEYQKKYLDLKEKFREETINEVERKYEYVLKEKELELLNQQQDLLENHNHALQIFANKASDNLKADIATINIYSNLILKSVEQDHTDRSLGYIDIIESAANTIFEKITNLTRYTVAGVEEYETEEVDLNDLFFIAKSTMRRSFIEVNAKLIISPGLPTIKTGYKGLLQVVQIIIGNAIKYRKAEEPLIININCKIENKQVLISISDNGIGIDENDFDRVFNVFESVNSADASSGSGIGLSTAKRVLEKLSGSISLESILGKGSTFIISLPVKESELITIE